MAWGCRRGAMSGVPAAASPGRAALRPSACGRRGPRSRGTTAPPPSPPRRRASPRAGCPASQRARAAPSPASVSRDGTQRCPPRGAAAPPAAPLQPRPRAGRRPAPTVPMPLHPLLRSTMRRMSRTAQRGRIAQRPHAHCRMPRRQRYAAMRTTLRRRRGRRAPYRAQCGRRAAPPTTPRAIFPPPRPSLF